MRFISETKHAVIALQNNQIGQNFGQPKSNSPSPLFSPWGLPSFQILPPKIRAKSPQEQIQTKILTYSAPIPKTGRRSANITVPKQVTVSTVSTNVCFKVDI
jgi:hypothetical protein